MMQSITLLLVGVNGSGKSNLFKGIQFGFGFTISNTIRVKSQIHENR